MDRSGVEEIAPGRTRIRGFPERRNRSRVYSLRRSNGSKETVAFPTRRVRVENVKRRTIPRLFFLPFVSSVSRAVLESIRNFLDERSTIAARAIIEESAKMENAARRR